MNTKKEIKNYIARQEAWVKANNIKAGTKALVLRKHESYCKGWNNTWVEGNMIPGRILTVDGYDEYGIFVKEQHYNYPYTVLLPLNPTGNYVERTFISPTDNEEYRCIIDSSTKARLGEFGFQETDHGSCIRKVCEVEEVEFDVYGTKGYYWIVDTLQKRLQLPKVIASELHIPWIPHLQY